ncbi:MAG: hypothetical protein KAQ75_12580 [Bacteroidales bacterium]|nr:hypothetical protein [Bacteroidales bacterium]
MEKEVFRSKYGIMSYDEQSEILFCKFLSETKNITNKEWKSLMITISKVFEKYKPQIILDDNRERLYAYSPDMQAWILKLFMNSWGKIGLKKYVQILPKDIIGQISTIQIEELINTNFSPPFKIKFVEDFDSAINWIRK